MLDTNEKLAALTTRLEKADWIAVDTEADSLHAYPEKLCLIQISATDLNELVDPLASVDLRPLFDVLRRHELIFHAADYDLRLFRRAFEFIPEQIFDTMEAARLLGHHEFGLTHLVKKYLDVTLEKGPQKANWARRPLTERMQVYARNDTRYLKPVADLLREELRQKGRLNWHQETCARLIVACAQPREVDTDRVWRLSGSSRLTRPGLAILRELWEWREREATVANKPPFFVLSHDQLVAIAGAASHHLPYVEHLPRSFSIRRRSTLDEAIARGLRLPLPQCPEFIQSEGRRSTEPEKRRLAVLKKKRDHHALQLEIDPTLIASRVTLDLLARDGSNHHDQLMRWQRELLLD